MHRAYSVLEIKAVDEAARVITGMATTPTPDRMGDIIEPKGAQFKLPLPLLWQHDSKSPIGHVTKAKVTATGIEIAATIAKDVSAEIDRAWTLIKSGLVRGLSIGFRGLDTEEIPNSWSIKFKTWEWLELSAVTIPANSEATIQTVKQFDTGASAALGHISSGSRVSPPALRDSTTKLNPHRQEAKMKTSEKIAALEARRTEVIKSWESLKDLETKTAEQKAQIKQYREEVAALDDELDDEKAFEQTLSGTAKAIEHKQTPYTAPAVPKKKELPGIAFTRVMKAKAVSKLEGLNLDVVAAGMYGKDSETYHLVTKANEVLPGTTISGNWGYNLISQEGGALAEFIEFLREGTIVGKFGTNGIPALRTVEFYRAIVSQTEGGDGYWVGEAKPKPLTAFNFTRDTLTPLKLANICVLSDENIRYSTPASDMIIRDQLAKALIKVEDVTFIDPGNSGTSGSKPASITNGAASIGSTGPDIEDVILDVRSLIAKYTDANNDVQSGVFVMSPNNANALATMVNALGQLQFPGMSMNGGRLFGFPVIVSKHAGTNVVLLNASDVLIGTDGGVMIDVSRETALEMKEDGHLSQVGSTGTGASLVSMFQNNLVAFRAEKIINWMVAPERIAVAYLTSVIWGGAVVPS